MEPDVVMECTGAGRVIADCLQVAAVGGVGCLTGVGAGSPPSRLAAAEVATRMVERNNALVGSVNADKRHWHQAAQALARADRSWLARSSPGGRVRPTSTAPSSARRTT
jgi:threonine dehydrogenase-like Zn-dependent dehydrogenase